MNEGIRKSAATLSWHLASLIWPLKIARGENRKSEWEQMPFIMIRKVETVERLHLCYFGVAID